MWQLWDEARSLKEETWNLPRLPGPGRPLSPGGGPCVSPSARCPRGPFRPGLVGRPLPHAQPAGWGLPPTRPPQPPLPEAGRLSLSLAPFWADFPERLGVGSTLTPKSALLPDSQSPRPLLGFTIHPPPYPHPRQSQQPAALPTACSLLPGRPWRPAQPPPQRACAALSPVSRAPHGDVEVPGQGEPVLLSPSRPEWSAKCYEPLMPKELPAAGWDTHPSGQY